MVKRLLVLLLIAAPAFAANSVNIDSMSAYATYHNIGVRIYYTGDDDSNMVVRVGVRHRDRRAGVDTLTMFRANKDGANTTDPDNDEFGAATTDSKQLYAGSALMCGADSVFDFFVTVTDADGCTSCPSDFANPRTPTFSARTLVNNTTARMASLPVGKQIFMSPYGSDANNGRDRAHPVLTFNNALGKMTTLGDQIRLMSGTYYAMRSDSLGVASDTKNGIGSKYYSVVGDTGVVISGVDTLALDPAGWRAIDIGGGTMAYVRAFSPARWPRAIVLGDTSRLYPYTSFYRLLTDAVGVVNQFGCFWETADGDSIYLRPPRRLTPSIIAGHTLAQDGGTSLQVRVPARNTAMLISSAFWRVDSLTFKDFGTSNDAGLVFGIIDVSNQGSVIENCTFVDGSRPSVAIRYFFDTPRTPLRTQRITIQNNTFITHTVGQTWSGPGTYIGFDKMAGLSCSDFNAGDTTCLRVNLVYPTIAVEVGRGHVIRWNRAVGGGDSFLRTLNVDADTTQVAITDFDVYQNLTMNFGDDVIEPDGMSGLNARIYKNTLLGGHTPMNWYVLRGPFYFVFNTCINQSGMLPRGNDAGDSGVPRGHTIIANNTFATSLDAAHYMWAGGQNSNFFSYANHVVVNNVINGYAGTIYEGGIPHFNEFNYNTTFSTTGSVYGAVNYTSIEHTVPTIQAWRDSTGYGANDTNAGSLQFADSTGWDWSPKSTWTDVLGPTHGRSFPGVNTNLALHVSPAWWMNRSGLSDSTYAGAWPVNGKPNELLGEPLLMVPRRP
jgi:hypothetical protein